MASSNSNPKHTPAWHPAVRKELEVEESRPGLNEEDEGSKRKLWGQQAKPKKKSFKARANKRKQGGNRTPQQMAMESQDMANKIWPKQQPTILYFMCRQAH